MDLRHKKIKNQILKGTALLLGLMVVVAPLGAEVVGPYSMGFNINFPDGVGDTSDVVKNGFGFGLDFGYRPETSPLGLRLDMIYSNFGLTSDVLKQINFADSGFASVWGAGLSVLLAPRHTNTVRPYIHAGPGFFHERAEASRFQGGGGVVCDPWFGCYEISNSQTVQDWDTWRLGWVGGAGLNVEFEGGGAFFMQAQYYRVNNTNLDTEIVPLAIGYRQSF